jgi:pantoate--beta-alanine ligase
VRAGIEAAGGRVDYVELRDRGTLAPLAVADRPALLAVAAFFGNTRLLDNVFLG